MTATASATALAWIQRDRRRADVVTALVIMALAAVLVIASPDDADPGWPDVAAGIGAFVTIALRRRWPRLLLAVLMVWTSVQFLVVGRPSLTIFATFVLLATVCVRLDRRPAIVLGAVVAVVLFVVAVIAIDSEVGDARALIVGVWTALAVGVADAVRSWRRYRESAAAQLQSAVEAADAQARQAVSDERLAIARELHDVLAHNLSVMNVQTGAALHLLRADPDAAETALTAARDAGRTVLDELRELLSVMRSDDDGDDGGDPAPRSSLPAVDRIDTLVATMEKAGLLVSWTDTGERRNLTPAVSLAAYRIVQEALTNAARHGTGPADLTTAWDEHGLTIEVSNARAVSEPTRAGATTGAGGAGGGHGLIGMRERAVGSGGTFEAGPRGGVFTVEAWLPTASSPAATIGQEAG